MLSADYLLCKDYFHLRDGEFCEVPNTNNTNTTIDLVRHLQIEQRRITMYNYITLKTIKP